jgi:hypothetical protein
LDFKSSTDCREGFHGVGWAERVPVPAADGGPIRVEVEAALKKIYGQPLPGEVVDVAEVRSLENSQTQIADSQGGGND